jgi:5-methylcytosine-specific restriction protein B
VRYDNEGKRKKDDNGLELTLPYSGNSFGIPANLDIICTMNTADRSIALLDTALRRRFDFREMMPDYETIKGNDNNGKISEHDIDLRKLLKTMNERIRILVGRDLQLGHSFFCSVKTLSDLQKCFSNKIIPLLQEYFYGNWERIRLVLGDSGKKEDICFIQSKNFNKNILSEFEEPEIKDFYVNPKLNELSAEAFRKIYLEPENAATEANS